MAYGDAPHDSGPRLEFASSKVNSQVSMFLFLGLLVEFMSYIMRFQTLYNGTSPE